MTPPTLEQQSPPDRQMPSWSRIEEADNFARTVKLFRQGRYDADSFRRFRLQHGAYGTRMTGDYAMVRIKVPAGCLYPAQMEKVAELSEAYSIGSAHMSTRENVQLHWVILEDVSEIMRGLSAVGMTSREACGNTVRNVMCSPLSGVCPAEKFDATPYALATARFFLRNPMNQNLPRKFKFNFTCCEEHGMARMVDVGLVPAESADGAKRGFKVFLGGGLGNKSFVGHQLEEFTPEEDLLYTSMAVLRIFDRLGDRKNMARNRMRYMVSEMGWEKFQNLVLKERAIMRSTQSITVGLRVSMQEATAPPSRPMRASHEDPGSEPAGYSRWLAGNTVAQKQQGYASAFVSLEAGDITASQLRALASVCRDFSGEQMARCGFAQNLVLRHVHYDDMPALYSRLLGSGLARPGGLTMAAAVGCSGTTSCNLALTNSHRLAKEIQRKLLEERLDEDADLEGSAIKISGCPNSCGQHGIATIGFYGGGGRSGKDMFPNYSMSIGGRFDGRTRLGTSCMRVPAKRVIPAVLEIVRLFKECRSGPKDRMRDWLERVADGQDSGPIRDANALRKRLDALAAPPDKKDDADFYADYGSDGSYHARTGKGECAA